MMTKPTKKRKTTKMSASAKFLIGATSVGTLIGGWGIMGYASEKSDNLTSKNVPSVEQPVANLAIPTAMPLPTLAPLPTLSSMPPIPTLAPMTIILPTPIQGRQAQASAVGNNDGIVISVPAIPTLAPLSAMPAPPLPPPLPAPRPSNGGGGGGGGNVSTGS